jgi:starch-binding outer membrane protein, SusD/RagB family
MKSALNSTIQACRVAQFAANIRSGIIANKKINRMRKLIYIAAITVGSLTFSGCSDFFETNPDDILLGGDYIADINEFYSGYMGVASKVQKVADKAIILSELRGDLLQPTVNAPQGLWEIYNYNYDNSNEYANPAGYYDIIVNANDYIRKSIEYKSANPNAIPDAVFDAFISGTIRFKCWAYLMLGKLYGQAIYYDDPMVEYQPNHSYPTLELDALIAQLMTLMTDGVTYAESGDSRQITGMLPFTFTDYLYPNGGGDLTWNLINPHPTVLKMELDIWMGNYDQVIDAAIEYIYDAGSKRYKVSIDDYNADWRAFFNKPPTSNTREVINVVPFDYDNNQTHRLIQYFSPLEPNLFYLAPSQVAMDRFNRQLRKNKVDKGDNFRGNGCTFFFQNNNWIIRKYSMANESPTTVYRNDIHIILYRASDVHLFLAEALNHKGLFREALAILNHGIKGYYEKYPTDIRYPFNNAVQKNSLALNIGLRGQVDLAEDVPTADSIAEPERFMKQLDSLLVEETCLQFAAEGKSMFAMIRMAKKWNDPSIVADRVSAKYPEGKREQIRDLLLADPKNWFVKYQLK